MPSPRHPLSELSLHDFPFLDALLPQYLLAWAAEAALKVRATALEPLHLFAAVQALHCVDPSHAQLEELAGALRPGGPEWPPTATLFGSRLSRAPRVWDPSRLPLCRELARVRQREALDVARLTAREALRWAELARSGRRIVWKEAPPEASGPVTGEGAPQAPILALLDAAARLEAHVRSRVLGQGTAAAAIAEAYTRDVLAPVRTAPVVLTFLGPPGTGKTLAARALAEGLAMVDSKAPRPFVAFSMTQFQDAYSVSGLLAPSVGAIPQALQKEPASVILLDELEKAHPSLLTGLLPLLAGDPLPTAHGIATCTRDAWIVITTNLGVEHLAEDGLLDAFVEDPFEILRVARPRKHAWDPDAAPALPPEFVSRLAQGQAAIFRRPAAHHLLTLADRTPLR